MNIKIKGWEKISGFTYKGLCIVNPIHNAYETKYMADVLNLNLPQKPKWELNVLAPGHKWKAVTDDRFHIMVWDDNRFSTRKEVDRGMMSSIVTFRILFEELIDEMLALHLTLTQSSNSIHTGGILNYVQQNGNTINI
jgi:hypothetical protein